MDTVFCHYSEILVISIFEFIAFSGVNIFVYSLNAIMTNILPSM